MGAGRRSEDQRQQGGRNQQYGSQGEQSMHTGYQSQNAHAAREGSGRESGQWEPAYRNEMDQGDMFSRGNQYGQSN